MYFKKFDQMKKLFFQNKYDIEHYMNDVNKKKIKLKIQPRPV